MGLHTRIISPISIAVCLLGILSCHKTCQTGYENPNCSIETRAQFESLTYTATESRNLDSAYSYPATIIPHPTDIRKVMLTNMANGVFAHNVVGSVVSDTLTIAYQSPDTNGHYIQGIGILSSNLLNLNYVVTYTDSLPVIHLQTDVYQSTWIHQ